MAMELWVLSDKQLSSVAEWQKAIDAEGLPLRLSDADLRGNLSARLRDEETNIEYGIHDFRELKDANRRVSFDGSWKYAISFTWSSDLAEEIAAWMAATAYARATDGAIFDEQHGEVFTPEESLKNARDAEQRRPMMEAMLETYIERLSAKSPEAEAALRSFVERRSTKSSRQ